MITQDRLKELLSYNPETGVFTCAKKSVHRNVGDVVGAIANGYLVCLLASKTYKLHRLAFLYMTGNLPYKALDHINGNPSDNRWCNLREATVVENGRNRKTDCNTSTGIKGLYHRKGRYPSYDANVKVDGKRLTKSISLKGKVEADVVVELINWLKETRQKHHGDFARHE